MKLIFSTILCFVIASHSFAQNNFIKIETNKTLCLFSFLETSSNQVGTSSSFQKYIADAYKQDEKFNQLIDSYSNLNLEYSIDRNEFPEKRQSYYTSIKNLLWIAASNSTSIDDFNQRIIGFLPHQTQIKLIEILKNSESYYTNLIWDKEQEHISRLQSQLENYKDQISDLYLKISKFYNTSWNTDVPFKIMLYPIPLKNGRTTAIPKGNTLICSFLSHNKNDYKSLLGIIIHEMCHTLYKEQHPDFQQKIDQWFTNSTSPQAPLAYTFINESLATVLGNGWSYKQIHKELDPKEWYSNKHINGFAHALFPLVDDYLNDEKHIDQNFVNKSIDLFGQTFPKATQETDVLMNSLRLYSNTEKEIEIDNIANTIHDYFNIRSMWTLTPILSMKSKESLHIKEITKLLVIESDNSNTIIGLQKYFPNLKITALINTIGVFKDEKSKSTIIIINIDGLTKLNAAYKMLSNITYLENGMHYEIK